MPYCSHPFKIDLCLLLATATTKGSSVRSINKVHKFGSTYYRGEKKTYNIFFVNNRGVPYLFFIYNKKKEHVHMEYLQGCETKE
jgi:hypothetical protein